MRNVQAECVKTSEGGTQRSSRPSGGETDSSQSAAREQKVEDGGGGRPFLFNLWTADLYRVAVDYVSYIKWD